MSDEDRQSEQTEAGEAELTRLADGTLPESEQVQMRAQVAGSPELQARLREQERGLALVKTTGEIAAPAALRVSVEELTDGSTRGRARRARAAERRRIAVWRPRASMGLVALAVILIAVVSVALHGRSAPTVGSAARLALAAATGPAPSLSASDHDLLAVRPTGATGIPFPSYVGATGWRASGVRHDSLDGRHVTTVFYSEGGARVGYSIVSGPALTMPQGSTVRGPTGVHYVFVSSEGARIVTWRRGGHTCVIAGRSVTRRTLLALAAADEQV